MPLLSGNPGGAIVRPQRAARALRQQGIGDGFLAVFDGPARAVRCACAIAQASTAVRERAHPVPAAALSLAHAGDGLLSPARACTRDRVIAYHSLSSHRIIPIP